ncbi:hypothetical protein [Kitasatospora sp. NPDC004289]
MLPPAGYSAPPILEPLTGLVVHHRDRDGRQRDFDFSALAAPEAFQRSLAALFAARSRGWGAHETADLMFRHLRMFTAFLARRARPPRDVDEISAASVKAWWEQEKHTPSGRGAFRNVAGLLREDARLHSGPVLEELTRRVPVLPTKVESYAPEQFDRIREQARRTFRAALLRIEENAEHLERWRRGEFEAAGPEWALGEALDLLARTGDLPRNRDGELQRRYVRAVGGSVAETTWKRLFLDRMEATALGVLLMAQFALNLSVINEMPTPRAAPDPGLDGRPTYRVQVRKHRGGRFETVNAADSGAGSPGRLITQALRATRFARALAEDLVPGTDRLVAWRTHYPQRAAGVTERRLGAGPVRLGLGKSDAVDWGKQAGTGAPFARGRRTVVVERREPSQHTLATHERRYVLPDQRVQCEAAPVVAAGAAAAVQHARRRVELTARIAAERDHGHRETATADCSGAENGPAPLPDGRCGASFLICLGCENARVHADHHPRLVYLHQALGNARSALAGAVWERDWSDAHSRLEDLKGKVGEGAWRGARGRITAADREIVDDLLNGDLNP